MIVTERSGVTQTLRPFSISRIFKQGDIPSGQCARPVIDGSVPSEWQCDKKVSWPDGSLRHAIISFRATLESKQSRSIAFENTTSWCHLGNQATCEAAALSGAGMLAFNGGTWNGVIEATNGTTFTRNARTMITDGNFRYWLRGPVVTQVVAEDKSTRSYDFGWGAATTGLHPLFALTFYTGHAGVKVDALLENMWIDSLMDQTYSVAVKNGAGTTIYSRAAFSHYILGRWRKTFWDGTSLATNTIKWNFNMRYMSESKAIPYYDTTYPITDSQINTVVTTWNAGDKALNYGDNGLWLESFPTAGGRSDIGWMSSWYIQYLYTGDERLVPVIEGQANAGLHMPLHWRDSITDSSKKWCPTTCTGSNALVPALGYPVSVETRPGVHLVPACSTFPCPTFPTDPNDDITFVGTVAVSGSFLANWRTDIAHHPAVAYIPYILTGDPIMYEELMFWMSHVMGNSFRRNNEWGIITPTSQAEPRGQAWAIRTISQAAFVAVDGTPEKEYLAKHLEYQAEFMEGFFGITTGNYPPSNAACPGYSMPNTEATSGPNRNRWCYGRFIAGFGSNPLGFFTNGNRFVPDTGCLSNHYGAYDCSNSLQRSSLWMASYLYISMGMALDQGNSGFSYVHQKLADWWIDGILHPDSTPHVVAGGVFYASYYPAYKLNYDWVQTWAEFSNIFKQSGSTTLVADITSTASTAKVVDTSVLSKGDIGMWTRTVASGAITSITQSGTTATVTFSNPHKLILGLPLAGSGATVAGFNSSQLYVTAIPSPTQVQFTVSPAATTTHSFPSYSLKTPFTGIPVNIGTEIVNVCGIEYDGTLQIGAATIGSACTSGPSYGRGFAGGSAAQSWPAGTAVSRNYTTWNSPNDVNHAYPWVARAAHAFSKRYTSSTGRSGTDAYNWFATNLDPSFASPHRANGNPQWDLIADDGSTLAITTTSLPQITVNSAYSQTLAATGGTAPRTWSTTSGTLPSGLSLNASTGEISGTVTGTASVAMVFRVTDAAGAFREIPLALNATNMTAITISPTTLSDATVGTSYSQTFTASGGASPYSWQVIGSDFPPGLSLSVSGVMSGNPTTGGTYTFTIRATDNNGINKDEVLSLTVNWLTLSISTGASLPSGVLNVAYSTTIAATGGDGVYTWALVGGVFPAGMSLNASTGEISGTPNTAANYSFTVRCDSGDSQTSSRTFSLIITPPSTDVSFKGTRTRGMAIRCCGRAGSSTADTWDTITTTWAGTTTSWSGT